MAKTTTSSPTNRTGQIGPRAPVPVTPGKLSKYPNAHNEGAETSSKRAEEGTRLSEKKAKTENEANYLLNQRHYDSALKRLVMFRHEASTRDANGDLPIHVLATCDDRNTRTSKQLKTLLEVLLDLHPGSLGEADANGLTPIEIARMQGHADEHVGLLGKMLEYSRNSDGSRSSELEGIRDSEEENETEEGRRSPGVVPKPKAPASPKNRTERDRVKQVSGSETEAQAHVRSELKRVEPRGYSLFFDIDNKDLDACNELKIPQNLESCNPGFFIKVGMRVSMKTANKARRRLNEGIRCHQAYMELCQEIKDTTMSAKEVKAPFLKRKVTAFSKRLKNMVGSPLQIPDREHCTECNSDHPMFKVIYPEDDTLLKIIRDQTVYINNALMRSRDLHGDTDCAGALLKLQQVTSEMEEKDKAANKNEKLNASLQQAKNDKAKAMEDCERIRQQYHESQRRNQVLQEKVTTLEKTNRSLVKESDSLKGEVKTVKKRGDDLEKEVKVQEHAKQCLQEKVWDLERRIRGKDEYIQKLCAVKEGMVQVMESIVSSLVHRVSTDSLLNLQRVLFQSFRCTDQAGREGLGVEVAISCIPMIKKFAGDVLTRIKKCRSSNNPLLSADGGDDTGDSLQEKTKLVSVLEKTTGELCRCLGDLCGPTEKTLADKIVELMKEIAGRSDGAADDESLFGMQKLIANKICDQLDMIGGPKDARLAFDLVKHDEISRYNARQTVNDLLCDFKAIFISKKRNVKQEPLSEDESESKAKRQRTEE